MLASGKLDTSTQISSSFGSAVVVVLRNSRIRDFYESSFQCQFPLGKLEAIEEALKRQVHNVTDKLHSTVTNL